MKRYLLWLKEQKILKKALISEGNIHGVEENSNKDADKLVLNVINNNLEFDLTEVAIDCIHRAGEPKKEEEKGLSYNYEICQIL